MSTGYEQARPFPPTRWTLVARAGQEDEVKRARALEELCQIYWPPVYAYLRSRGNQPVDAEDLTQAFFASLLKHNTFTRAKRERGKLRTFLLAALSNFSASEYRKQKRQKRGGEFSIVSIDLTNDDGRPAVMEPEDTLSPEKIFERQWALTVLTRALSEIKTEYQQAGRGEIFARLHFLISPDGETRSYSEIGKELTMTEASVKVAAYRLRKRYAKALRAVIDDTITEGDDVEEELRQLLASFE